MSTAEKDVAPAIETLHLLEPGSLPWRVARREGLGASEVAAVLGFGKYQSPLTVWLEKKGLAEEREDSPQATVGRFAESAIAQLYEHTTKRELAAAPTVRHRTVPFLFASADRIALLENFRSLIPEGGELVRDTWDHLVEIKNRGGFPSGFGESGTDQVPDEIAIQAHVQMECYDLPRVVVAVLISGNDFRTYPLERNPAIGGPIIEQAAAWWEKHIIGGERPPLEGPNVKEYLAKKFAQKNREILKFEAGTVIDSKILELASVRQSQKELEEERDALEAFLKDTIGEAFGVETPSGLITWGTNKDSVKVDWESVAKVLGAEDKAAFDACVEAHTTIKPGPRVFRPKFAFGED